MAKDLILSMGAPPKLGAKQGAPRAFMKSFKGSMMPEREQPEASDENEFEQDKEGAPDEMLVGCAQDVLAASHSRDPEAYAEALKAFIQMC